MSHGDGATPYLTASRINMTFRAKKNAEPVHVIDDVSLSVGEGEFVSFLGPSGCGKTTLMRIIAGLETATSGTVEIRGRAVTGPHPDFGMAFQAPVLMPWRTALENVMYPLEVLGRADGKGKARARELLEIVGLADFANHRPAQLSGGMQQRVSLCRALVHEPSLLLMDEPFAAVDELTRLQLNDLMLDLRATTNATILFVTHSISEAVYLSDRVFVFSRRPASIVTELEPHFDYPRPGGVRHLAEFNDFEARAERALGLER